MSLSAIQYLEQRVTVLRQQQPVTLEGQIALTHTIHELINCILALQLDLLNALELAQQDAGIQ